jgi:hypothetical protein
MTYQQKQEELQKLFSEKFDAYEKFKKDFFFENEESEEYLMAKSEFENANNDLQVFLVLFKENNALPGDEFGNIGERCM